MLSHKNGSKIIYEPKSMSCSTSYQGSGHAFALIKTDGLWHEVNDHEICPVPQDLEKEIENYCSTFATVIIYERKKEEADTPTEETPSLSSKSFYQSAGLIRREKEFSCVKTIHHQLEREVMMSEQQQEELLTLQKEKERIILRAHSQSASPDDDKKLMEIIKSLQDFWKTRITQCEQSLSNASESRKPYWNNQIFWEHLEQSHDLNIDGTLKNSSGT